MTNNNATYVQLQLRTIGDDPRRFQDHPLKTVRLVPLHSNITETILRCSILPVVSASPKTLQLSQAFE